MVDLIKLNYDFNKYFCPRCHLATLHDHLERKFELKWNKCGSCGYMETKKNTENRLKNHLTLQELAKKSKD